MSVSEADKEAPDSFWLTNDPDAVRWATIRVDGKRRYIWKRTALGSLVLGFLPFVSRLVDKGLGYGLGESWVHSIGFGLFWLALTTLVIYGVFKYKWKTNERKFRNNQ
jgi:hypothetical protein